MKLRFEPLFRAWLLFLVILLTWGLWAAAQTGTNSAAAAQSAGPSQLPQMGQTYLTFGLDRVPALREHQLMGEPLWKYLASLTYIALAFLVTRLIDLVTRGWLRRLASRTKTQFDDLLLELLHGPIKVVALVIFLHIGLTIFDWSPSAKGYLEKGLILVVAASLTYLGVKVIGLSLEFWRQRVRQDGDTRFDDQLLSVVGKSLKAFVIVVAILVTAQNVGVNITAAITSLSIGGLAIGLAAQDTLANLFGAVAVFADKPFRVGDHIRLEAIEGVVEAVGLRSTRVRNGDGQLVTIPNKTVGNATITNISQRPGIKTVMNLALVHHTPVERIRRAVAILGEVYRGHPMTQEVLVSFNQFTGRNINLTVVHWWKGTHQPQYLAGMQEMNLEVKAKFDAEGITLGR